MYKIINMFASIVGFVKNQTMNKKMADNLTMEKVSSNSEIFIDSSGEHKKIKQAAAKIM